MSYNIYNYLKAADTFTFANMLCGLLSCSFLLKGEFALASRLIILAIVADGFDGYFARKTKKESDFGMNLDSLSDVVSFGVAPSLLFWSLNPHWWVIAIAFVYVACGVMRLARYNILHPVLPKGQYIGIPIPNAAFFLTLAMVSGLPFLFVVAVTVLASYLMISTLVIRKPESKREFPYINLVVIALVFIPASPMVWVARAGLLIYACLLVWYVAKGKPGDSG
jgi:CDP-diacylglycerol--serine O-phosphatidyltransferase